MAARRLPGRLDLRATDVDWPGPRDGGPGPVDPRAELRRAEQFSPTTGDRSFGCKERLAISGSTARTTSSTASAPRSEGPHCRPSLRVGCRIPTAVVSVGPHMVVAAGTELPSGAARLTQVRRGYRAELPCRRTGRRGTARSRLARRTRSCRRGRRRITTGRPGTPQGASPGRRAWRPTPL
jgi:hypothetical protein